MYIFDGNTYCIYILYVYRYICICIECIMGIYDMDVAMHV